MATDIQVESPQETNGPFHVTVNEGSSAKSYRVTLPENFYQKLTAGLMSKTDCLKASFRFLLDREPKESILSEFDLPVISRYFPEFEQQFKNYKSEK